MLPKAIFFNVYRRAILLVKISASYSYENGSLNPFNALVLKFEMKHVSLRI